MDNRSYIRSLMVLHKISVKDLAQKMTEIIGKKYTRDSINGKLTRDTLTLKECQVIAKILGYEVKFIKNIDRK
jgi:hypothetical protein